MARTRYVPEDLGGEVSTPSSYYQPVGKALVDYDDRRVLYVSGIAYIEASCCGRGSWQYLRVEGYVVAKERCPEDAGDSVEIETIEDEGERQAISQLLLRTHPGARIEFR
jgi:hypothetical protein